MSIIKGFNKARNTTYVYESESHWDKVKQQSRSKRKIIGKIDPETGNIVPTGPRGRKKSRRKKTKVQSRSRTTNSFMKKRLQKLMRKTPRL